MQSNVFYDSLRALGPVPATDIPDSLATQLAGTGAVGTDTDQIKATIALFSQVASTCNREEFARVLATGALPGGMKLADEAAASSAVSKSCCGHTCEGTCTK